jgi:sulfatase maturation enzyme AslB (radical SAM superfamily)
MKFCSFLTNDINFEPTGLQPCCNTRALAHVPLFPFSGGAVSLPAYAEHIANVGVALQRSGPLCAGCPELRETGCEELSAALLFRTVSLNQHRHLCNCRCVYCDLWKTPSHAYEILPALKSLHRQRALREDCFFSWGGGEPTLLPEFAQACRWISLMGFPQYVHTNALRWSSPVADLLAGGNGGINVSLDAGSPQVYNAVKGLDGFARVRDTLRRYVEAAQEHVNSIHLKYIIFSINNHLDEIEAFFALCRDLGVRNVQFSFDFREVNQGTLSDASLGAALFFIRCAQEQDMIAAPFFVDAALVRRLETLAQSL